jgi:hypothetical protein
MDSRSGKSGPRYDALDCVRASAMLLGVVELAILMGGMFGGGPAGPFGTSSASMRFMDRIHSFRMPLGSWSLGPKSD